MQQIKLTSSKIGEVDADAIIVGYFSDQSSSYAEEISDATGEFVGNLLNNGDFEAKPNEVVVLPYIKGLQANRLVLVGLGKSSEFNAAVALRAAGSAAKALSEKKLGHVVICFPADFLAEAVAGVIVGNHGQDIMRSEPKIHSFDSFSVMTGNTSAVTEGQILGNAINTARMLVNLPPNVLYPETFAERVETLGEESGFEVEVWDDAQLQEQECRTLLAVAQGSDKPPRMLTMKYLGATEDAPVLALVGKGVTFDSGGYSLKPSEGMLDMKCDMGGAATVVGAMQAVSLLNLPINVVGYCGLVENLVSGRAYKLGDVIRSRNGKTIEIHNTDAEGRLVLADVLDVASKSGADHIVDFATLTGACLVALGLDCAGLFTNDQKWCDQFREAADLAGEDAWQLPMTDNFSEQIKSNVADLKNVGAGRWGGSITAAKFLEEFVAETPWIHVDIAGPAWSDKEKKWIDAGGSGCFVRTLVQLAKEYSQANL